MPETKSPLPLISIVVPSYNQAPFLRDTFESIFRQEYPRLEVVVMDGGSTDGSVEIIREYAPRLKFWQSQKDGGQSAAINAGMQHSSGELVGWLNSDDFFWGDCLWTVARACRAHPEHGLYVGNGLRYVQSERRYYPFCTRHIAFNRESLLRGVDSVLQPAAFFLREAWDEAGGVDPALRYCMDWDIYLRIASRRPVVVINEFLAVSREYEETKTRTGKMDRAHEIIRMIRRHTGTDLTPGSLLYLLETLAELSVGHTASHVPADLKKVLGAVAWQVCSTHGRGDHPFPESCDPQDQVYIPTPRTGEPVRSLPAASTLPVVSVVCLTGKDVALARASIDSVLSQSYPRLELILAGPAAVVTELAGHYPESKTVSCETPEGAALNRGFEAATGAIVGWLTPGERSTQATLAEVGRIFAAEPALGAIVGNALLVDEDDRPGLIPHGFHRTAYHFGHRGPLQDLTRYWTRPELLPPPGVFFRRSLLPVCGLVAESYQHIYEHEFVSRLASATTVKKLERTQVICRAPDAAKLAAIRAELYEHSRSRWPTHDPAEFLRTWKGFLGAFLRQHLGGGYRGTRFYATAAAAGAASLTRLVNPEVMACRLGLHPPTPIETATPPAAIPMALEAAPVRRRVVFCLRSWPRQTEASTVEARDHAFLRQVMASSRGPCFLTDPTASTDSPLTSLFAATHTPETLQQAGLHVPGLAPTWNHRFLLWLRRGGVPVLGPRNHLAVTEQIYDLRVQVGTVLQATLERDQPEFFFVGPQDNPVVLLLQPAAVRTRFVLLADRVGAWANLRGLEGARARDYERRYLNQFDGIAVLSEADRRHFVEVCGVHPDRVAVLCAEEVIADPERIERWLEFLAGLPRVHDGTGNWPVAADPLAAADGEVLGEVKRPAA